VHARSEQSSPEIVGEPYRDGDGRLYTPMIREPIFVYGATSAELTRTHDAASKAEAEHECYRSGNRPYVPCCLFPS
jgi:hypothetical protein